ncbi:MAG: ABC transporter ATP-binding protein [Reyranella sp.]|uniref:ABC transporter ATP-binding protein n=1 Tax=Reyranella sp. TaxID=1929291 RepID=UPI00121E2358|nr:ABC transporter ATP-binding protein [Reyranella sp.]TAJ96626.1 MAG: ABC transporter ATP-binding protein [Reyranella sp.]
MTMSKPARAVGIEISGVNLSYGTTHVLKDVALSIRPGEFFAFLGPSGCGKTTLLRLIAGFAQAQTGKVLLDGQDVAPLPPWKRDVGMVFQSYALWPHMTVAKNVAFGLEERRLPRAEIDRRVSQALELVGLSAFAERRPAQLSGGQQQRVAVARTIAVEPKVLLLDEPLSNLDAKMRVTVRRELRSLQQRLGLTTIFVTHDQEEANTICDRIAVMDAGRIQQVGTPMELYENPANLFVANFLGSANILDERAGVPIPAGKRLVFRPQHATLSVAAGASLHGPVTHREFLGATVRYAVRIGDSEVLIETPFQSGRELRMVGDMVGVDLPPQRMLFLPA